MTDHFRHHLFAVLLLVVLLTVTCTAAASSAPVIKDGDRVVFLGDSITEQRLYTRYVMNAVTGRMPKAKVSFRNAGWGGDSAPGALKRLERDVLSLKPDVVTICFGMNDGQPRQQFTQQLYDTYINGMTGLITELKMRGVRVALITNGCVDPKQKCPWLPDGTLDNYNEVLSKLSRGLIDLAKKQDVPCFDLFTLMLEVQNRAKAADPSFTMIPDSVHPNAAGHAVMAYALLAALGFEGPVSEAVIDAASGRGSGTGCRISNIATSTGKLAFGRADVRWPSFIDADAAKVYPYFDHPARVNSYTLKVTGLADGRWELQVDGRKIGTFSSSGLALGVNLADAPGPWRTAAEAVNAASARQEDLYFRLWRQIGVLDVPKEAAGQKSSLVDRMQELIDSAEQSRIAGGSQLKPTRWVLSLIP